MNLFGMNDIDKFNIRKKTLKQFNCTINYHFIDNLFKYCNSLYQIKAFKF